MRHFLIGFKRSSLLHHISNLASGHVKVTMFALMDSFLPRTGLMQNENKPRSASFPMITNSQKNLSLEFLNAYLYYLLSQQLPFIFWSHAISFYESHCLIPFWHYIINILPAFLCSCFSYMLGWIIHMAPYSRIVTRVNSFYDSGLRIQHQIQYNLVFLIVLSQYIHAKSFSI